MSTFVNSAVTINGRSLTGITQSEYNNIYQGNMYFSSAYSSPYGNVYTKPSGTSFKLAKNLYNADAYWSSDCSGSTMSATNGYVASGTTVYYGWMSNEGYSANNYCILVPETSLANSANRSDVWYCFWVKGTVFNATGSSAIVPAGSAATVPIYFNLKNYAQTVSGTAVYGSWLYSGNNQYWCYLNSSNKSYATEYISSTDVNLYNVATLMNYPSGYYINPFQAWKVYSCRSSDNALHSEGTANQDSYNLASMYNSATYKDRLWLYPNFLSTIPIYYSAGNADKSVVASPKSSVSSSNWTWGGFSWGYLPSGTSGAVSDRGYQNVAYSSTAFDLVDVADYLTIPTGYHINSSRAYVAYGVVRDSSLAYMDVYNNGTAISQSSANIKAIVDASDYKDAIWLYPNFQINTYNITYSLGGGSLTLDTTTSEGYALNPSTQAYNGSTNTSGTYFRVGIPTRTGYTFTGWTITGINTSGSPKWSGDGDTTDAVSITTTSLSTGVPSYCDESSGVYMYFRGLTCTDGGTITFTANWTVNTYTVNYYQGTTLKGSSTYEYDEEKALTSISDLGVSTSLNGATFYGWANATNKYTRSYIDSNVVSNLTSTNGGVINLYAIFQRTATFYYGYYKASNITTTQYIYYNSNTVKYYLQVPTAPAVPTTLSDYGWSGFCWYWTSGVTSYSTISLTATNYAGSYYNFYEKYSRTVTLNYSSGDSDYVELIYHSNGSSANTDYTDPYTTRRTNAYAVSGTIPSSQTKTQYYNSYSTLASSATFTLASNPFTKEGYAFTSWSLGSEGGTTTSPTCKASNVLTATAQWNINDNSNSVFLFNLIDVHTIFAVPTGYDRPYGSNSSTRGWAIDTAWRVGSSTATEYLSEYGINDDDGNVTDGIYLYPTQSLNLYANWVNIINLDPEDGTQTNFTKFYYQTNTSSGGYYYFRPYNSSGASLDGEAGGTAAQAGINSITIPTKTGYVFKGYYSSTNGSGTQYINENGIISSSLYTSSLVGTNTLYAYWVPYYIQSTDSPWIVNTTYGFTLREDTEDADIISGYYYFGTSSTGSPTTILTENGVKVTPTSTGTYYIICGLSSGEQAVIKQITVNKANGQIYTEPSFAQRVYNGSAQTVVTAGSGTGTMYYCLVTDTSATKSYSTSLPTLTDPTVSTYYLYYYAAASRNYNKTAETYKTWPGTPPSSGNVDLSKMLIKGGTVPVGDSYTIPYIYQNSTWKQTVPLKYTGTYWRPVHKGNTL